MATPNHRSKDNRCIVSPITGGQVPLIARIVCTGDKPTLKLYPGEAHFAWLIERTKPGAAAQISVAPSISVGK